MCVDVLMIFQFVYYSLRSREALAIITVDLRDPGDDRGRRENDAALCRRLLGGDARAENSEGSDLDDDDDSDGGDDDDAPKTLALPVKRLDGTVIHAPTAPAPIEGAGVDDNMHNITPAARAALEKAREEWDRHEKESKALDAAEAGAKKGKKARKAEQLANELGKTEYRQKLTTDKWWDKKKDGEGDDDDEGDDAGARHGPVPARVSVPLSNLYDRAVRRALADPFVPYENVAGIINLAECASGDGWRATGLEDAPDLSPSALVDATLAELRDLFGASGVVAEAALTFALADGAAAAATDPAARDDPGGDDPEPLSPASASRAAPGSNPAGGFVWTRLAQFQETPDWEGEADLWESLLETYGVLLAPGALRGAAEPGWFLMCVAGRDEEELLAGMDRLRTQLLQRKFLHGRW